MLEPNSSAAGAIAAAILLTVGPDAGGHALIILGALVGVMHSLGRVHTATKTEAALYVVKWVMTAALLTGFVAEMLQQHAGIPATRWPGVVAFFIAFLSDRWPALVVSGLRARLRDWVIDKESK